MTQPKAPAEAPAREEVVQADRDAAADMMDAYRDRLEGKDRSASAIISINVRNGLLDDSYRVQAFRKHRLAHTPAPQIGEAERLRIAWWNDMRERGVSQDTAIAKIRAALHPAQGGGEP